MHVHVSISGDDEVTVVWSTRVPLGQEHHTDAVKYECTNSDNLENTSDVIDKVVSSKTHPWHLGEIFESSSYTQQMCMASAMSLTAPVMGGPKTPVSPDVLAKLANTSSWADADASNYKIVNNFTDVVPDEWFTMTKPPDKTVCLGYSNANGG